TPGSLSARYALSAFTPGPPTLIVGHTRSDASLRYHTSVHTTTVHGCPGRGCPGSAAPPPPPPPPPPPRPPPATSAPPPRAPLLQPRRGDVRPPAAGIQPRQRLLPQRVGDRPVRLLGPQVRPHHDQDHRPRRSVPLPTDRPLLAAGALEPILLQPVALRHRLG